MIISQTLYVTNREEWRAWLEKNYDKETEIWLIYYKAHTGRARIPYDDAVEEALCFGWIDSIVKRIDEEKFAQKFTPRRDNGKWSELNKRRVQEMIAQGRMTDAGLKKYQPETPGKRRAIIKKELVIPEFVMQALMPNPKAWENFNNLSPSYRRNYILWITAAKREETRQRRLQEAIELLEQNKKLGMK